MIEPFTRFSQESLFLPILNKQSYCYADSRFQKSPKMVNTMIDLFLCSYPVLFNFKKVSGCRMYVNEFPEVDEVVMVQVLVFLSI